MDTEAFSLENAMKLLNEKKYADLRKILTDVPAADIAEMFEEIPKNQFAILYRILPKELAADVFVELDPDFQQILIEAFSDKELREVLDELYMDDTVDLIEEILPMW